MDISLDLYRGKLKTQTLRAKNILKPIFGPFSTSKISLCNVFSKEYIDNLHSMRLYN